MTLTTLNSMINLVNLVKNIFFSNIEMKKEVLEAYFFDYLQKNWSKDFAFVKGTGLFF